MTTNEMKPISFASYAEMSPKLQSFANHVLIKRTSGSSVRNDTGWAESYPKL
jgi:hypothetical protein